MEGIKETREIVMFAATLGNAIGKAAADGKVDFTDIFHFVPVLQSVSAGVEGLAKVPAELKDLTAEEYTVIAEAFQKEFNIPQDDIERKVEIALKGALVLAQLVYEFKGA